MEGHWIGHRTVELLLLTVKKFDPVVQPFCLTLCQVLNHQLLFTSLPTEI